MKIYIIRHTAVDVAPGTTYGQTNVPLKDTFEQEAEIVKQNLEGIMPDLVCSSPLSRCRKLATYCGYDDIQYFDRLKELHLGAWEMCSWDDIDIIEWEKDSVNTPAPRGESFKDMYNRVASFFDELKETDHKTVIIFAHGGVINCTRVYFGQAKLEATYENMVTYGEMLEFELQ